MMLERLLKRLHRVFDRTPNRVPVISIAYDRQPCLVSVAARILTLKGAGSDVYRIDLTDITIAGLVTAINALPSFGSTLLNSDFAGLLAWGLVEDADQDIAQDPQLYYAASLLYNEFQVYARIMQDQADREANAEKQLYGNTAEDIWLDSWLSDNFGVPRNIGETDLAYFTRAKYEIFSLKVNNKALMKLIADAVSYFVDVKDLGAIPGGYFYTNRPNSITNNSNSADSLLFNTTLGNVKDGVFGVYIYNGSINNFSALDKKAITGIVQRYKAEGTRAIYFAPAQRLITNHLGANLNNIEYVIGPRYTGWAEVIV